MDISKDSMKDNPVYSEEFIRQNARIDVNENRDNLSNEKIKNTMNRNFIKYLIIGLGFLIFLYVVLFLPLMNMVR